MENENIEIIVKLEELRNKLKEAHDEMVTSYSKIRRAYKNLEWKNDKGESELNKLSVGDIKRIKHQYGEITGLVYKETDGIYAVLGLRGEQNLLDLSEINSIEDVTVPDERLNIMREAQRLDKEMQKGFEDAKEYERLYKEELKRHEVISADIELALIKLNRM